MVLISKEFNNKMEYVIDLEERKEKLAALLINKSIKSKLDIQNQRKNIHRLFQYFQIYLKRKRKLFVL